MSATVECYAGTRYPERPRAFVWQGNRMTVQKTERQWQTPTGLAFRVVTPDGRRFALTYNRVEDAWTISAAGE